jgi:hypothetical protein
MCFVAILQPKDALCVEVFMNGEDSVYLGMLQERPTIRF